MRYFIFSFVVLIIIFLISGAAHAQVGPLVFASYKINDDDFPLSLGDNDGRPESCETIELAVSLTNLGTATATDVEVQNLSCSDPDISVIDTDNCWGSIPGGTTKENECQFGFVIKSSLTAGKTITFSMTILASNGGPWNRTFNVNIYVQNQEQFFCDVFDGSPGVKNTTVTWADIIGNDGRLDFLTVGQDNNLREVSKLYRNDAPGGHFVDVSTTASIIGVRDGSAAWGDYDNDEDLDLLLTGDATNSHGLARVARLYRYEGGGRFTDISTSLPGVRNGAGVWGDYDNDGDLDILLTGSSAPGVNITKIYKNEKGSFSEAVSLPGVAGGSAAAWGDYDNDGDLDILLTGQDITGNPVAMVYRNTNGSFENIGAPLTGVSASAVAWGDYDSDGDLDILLAGRQSNGNRITRVYRNTNGSFADINAGLPGITNGSVAWGDYDNDGDLDILLVGEASTGSISKVYRNNNDATFSDTAALLIGVKSSSANWGDYDNDGDLDILLAGEDDQYGFGPITKVYRNTVARVNTRPAVPTNLSGSITGSSAIFRWNKSTDNETAQNGLTYNVRLGTTPNGIQNVSPMSNLANGFRRVPKIGNASHLNSFTIKNLSPGTTYYWSVQAVDNAFAGSAFAAEQSFTVPPNRVPVVANVIPNPTLSVSGPAFTRDLNASPAVFNDPDGDVLTYTANSSATNIATASISGSILTVTPIAGGSATITVTANDGRGGTVSTTFTVTVTTNRAPVVVSTIPNQNLTVGGTPFTQNLMAIFSDPDGDALIFTASSSATNIATASISGSTLTVTAVSGGSATITVTATDGKSQAVSTSFTVTVANRPPVVVGTIPNQSLTVGGTPFTQNLTAIFSDPDGDALIFTGSSSATNIATASISGSTLTVTAVSGGSATITVTATDGKSQAVSTSFTVTVANRPPVVVGTIPNQSLTVGGTPFTQSLTAIFSDPDGDALIFTASSSATNIATANVPTGSSILTVTAVSGGIAVITVTATDGKSQAVSTSFTVTVANRPPVVTNTIPNQSLTVGGTPFTQNLNTVFSDPDGDALAFTASSSATNIATASISGSTLTVTPIAGGSATITVTANDGKGGSVSTTFTVTVTDNQPPRITHTPIMSAVPGGQPILITATVSDDRGILSVQLMYRRGGATSFSAVTMTSVSGANNYQALIPASDVTSRGVEYFILVTDVDNAQTRLPSTGGFSIQIQVTSEAKPTAQPSGSAATAYRLISVPLQLDNPSANAILEDDLGAYDDTKWRLYGLTPATSENLSNKEPYTELRTGGDLSPGKSLFLIVRDPGKTITIGAAKSLKTDQEFQITLQRGHNFVGTPFNFTIPASKLRLQSGGTVNLRTFTGSFTPATEMQPWEGYYIANLNQASDILIVNPNLSAAAISKATGSGWRLRILASCGEARDDYNFAGASLESHDGYDGNDLSEPPPIGEYVSVYFPHPEWQKPLSRFSDDIRSASNPNQKWRFVVESNISNELVMLRFDGLKEIDAASAVFLVDEALQYKQNLRANAIYSYQPRNRESAKAFTLIVGKDDFISEQTANAQGAPENFVLEQNFPNPFNPETAIRFGLPQQSVVTIKIFDLAGHEVATLLDRVELPAGRHQRVWDGRDAQGRTTVSGIYFCRLTATGFAKTVKLTMMR
ncbi:MAG: FG-GAP-like repeat-containing protein [candidate division KSB1 bacterium]|nr:FG-GAP-like repeat-containing protein [candidate division KSB1 bacterium]MDZ7365388.1 FG-GAP-like repeat-containing protein [candidate division KSB1 bacterium]MDZ7403565.1 FG-GAP-like repeat-containing protein [candidate division KSB1 bacterium]